jgi:hypothetical protein
LDDAAARAARRARVLAAVAREPATPAAASSPRHAWRRGHWLAAASVAGLGLLVATQIDEPAWRQPPTTPATPTSAAPASAALPGPLAPAASAAPPAFAAIPRAATPASPPELAKAAPPPVVAAAPAPQAFPATAAPPPPPPSAIAVTAERRESDQDMAAQSAQRGARVPVAVSAFTGQSRDVQPNRSEALAGLPPDQAARLRAAAAAGRTSEVQVLLDQGVPVDAPDANGDTALMRSIQADHPAAAALLRRHGASLDRQNHAGESARDMTTAKGDVALSQALGLGQ